MQIVKVWSRIPWAAISEGLTCRLESKVNSDGEPDVTATQGIYPRHFWALIDPSHQYIGVNLPQNLQLRSPWIPASQPSLLTVMVISHNSIRMDMAKVRAVSDWPTPQKCQQTPTLHWILKLIPKICCPLLENHPITSWPEKGWHPIFFLDQEVSPSIQGYGEGLYLGINIEDFRPVQTICAEMWLLVLCLGISCLSKIQWGHKL